MLSTGVPVVFLFCLSCYAYGMSEIEQLQKQVGHLARQVMMQQLFMEERIRSDGDSGIKQCRIHNDGTKAYHMASAFSKRAVGSAHDHPNHRQTLGMGEFVAVLNGVEFRTRHNDYLLRMPTTSRNFLETEEIPFPDVPPEVTSKASVKEQIEEMREWFRAWRDQNHTVRDYRQYFKPVLCYLEGTWIDQNYADILEPFKSDRHRLDAKSFEHLQDKAMFLSYGGRKNPFENVAWLPSTVMDVINGTTPKYAQWIYRINCHPLKRDLPTNRFRLVDDLSARVKHYESLDEHRMSRRARFQLNPRDRPKWTEGMVRNLELIDELMGQVPGLDNYGANLTDETFGIPAYDLETGSKVNVGYYHRWWGELKTQLNYDKPGLAARKRLFADRNLYMAMNTQPAVASKSLHDCKSSMAGENDVCTKYNQRWSYAIPMEVVYLTPLTKWNPYDIPYRGDADEDPEAASVAENGKRTGGKTVETAYNGTNSKLFYQTPASFFKVKGEKSTRKTDDDPYANVKSIGVLDKNGVVRSVKATGHRLLLLKIPDVGMLRQRYPIMPLHDEGNSVYKELEALKDLVMERTRYSYLYREPPLSGDDNKIDETPIVSRKTRRPRNHGKKHGKGKHGHGKKQGKGGHGHRKHNRKGGDY